MKIRFLTILTVMGLMLSLAGCGQNMQNVDAAKESLQIIAMDTVISASAYGENSSDALQAVEQEIYRLEKIFSRTNDASEVSSLNRQPGKQVKVGQEVCGLIEAAAEYTAATDGAFDVSVAPVVSAWGFTEAEHRVPEQAELENLLEHVGMEHVHVGRTTVQLDEGTQIDLGGIAKGYASDVAAEIYREYEVSRGTVALGGNVFVRGTREDGAPWRVGIQDPANLNDTTALVGMLHLSDAFAVTSGSYQRYFEKNGKVYHHIIDPATGYPADSGLTSVTVIAPWREDSYTGTMCDALSTALFVMGEERALDFWQSSAYEMELVLVTEDGRVLVTEGAADWFTAAEDTGYVYETVS